MQFKLLESGHYNTTQVRTIPNFVSHCSFVFTIITSASSPAIETQHHTILSRKVERGLCGEIKVHIFLLPSVQDRFLFFFSWITHVFISCLWPHFHFTTTLSTSQLCLVERGVGRGGSVLIRVTDGETIHPEWKRNRRIC